MPSAMSIPTFQALAGSIKNADGTTPIYSAGVWSFKNSSGTTTFTVSDAGVMTVGPKGTNAHTVNGQFVCRYNADNGGIVLQGNVSGDISRIYAGGSSASGGNNGTLEFWSFRGDSGNAFKTMELSNTGAVTLGPSAGGVTHTIRGQVNCSILNDTSSVKHIEINTNGFTYLPRVYANTSANAANVFVGSSGDTYRSTSAAKYKTNIRALDSGLSVVKQMYPVRYNSICENDDKQKDFIGFIADNEEGNVPELVVKNNEGEVEGFSYDRLTAVLVKAIQELAAINDSQAAMLADLQAQIDALKAKIP